MQYISPTTEIDVKPHGNSKSAEPYFRTSKSTLAALKSELKSACPKEAVERVSKEKGGEMSAMSAGSLPRNRQQAYNASKQQRTQDPLYNLILECQNLPGEEKFIREIKLSPEPSVMIVMDYQLSELEAFCTNPYHHCVFGIDPTFNLGPFNVTVTTYKQFQLVKPNGQAPTFVGPLFIHYRKTFGCYNSFASGLLGLNKNLANIKAFGTDGEGPLIDAFSQQCHFATFLTCFTHCRGNIKRKLQELGAPSDIISEYLFEIFGGQRGTTFVEGLADASSATDFDTSLAALENVWNEREQSFSSPPQFFSYFKQYKVPVFKESMIKPIRVKAGLGNPPIEYHNNCPECMNNVIKMKVDRKRNSIDDFCSKMKSLVQEQRNHLIRAATCRGEYRLHPAFKEFEVSHLKWFGFTEGARTKHIQRLCDFAYKYMDKFKPATSDDDISLCSPCDISVCSPCDSQEECDELQDETESTLPQNIHKEISDHTFVPESTAKNICTKAEDLLKDVRAITAHRAKRVHLQGFTRLYVTLKACKLCRKPL